MGNRLNRAVIVACLAVVGCQDSTRILQPTASVRLNESEGRGWFHRYVAIGTSVSQGWASDGVYGTGQLDSWPAQLSRMAHRDMSLPLIADFGCKAPLAAPLITFTRISGEPPNVTNAAAQCAPNETGVVLPTQNVAISGARTDEALNMTPEAHPDPLFTRLYSRILPPGATQVTAMEQQNPKFVSVELGANDILGVHSGIAIPGVSMTPFNVWSAAYNQILDRVGGITKNAVLVGFGIPAANLSSLRRGSELWADRTAFLASFNVDVSADCDGNTNLIVVPTLVVPTVAAGLVRAQNGLPPAVLSCTGGGPTTQDRILTASEEAAANAQLALIDAHIQSEATARGYAVFQLGALYNLPKPTFSVVTLMTSSTPYGAYISLDGIHPSALGHTILAQAAAQAIEAHYNLGLASTALDASAWLRH